MPLDLFLDNDVIIKLARWGLLGEVRHLIGERVFDVLPTATWVVRGHLKDNVAALHEAEVFIAQAVAIELTEEELALSTQIADASARFALPVDPGEGILFAAACHRGRGYLVTGEKRAIIGAEVLLKSVERLADLSGRFVCLEQLAIALVEGIGDSAVREKICADAEADKTLAICLGCASRNDDPASHAEGMLSYISDLRSAAPSLLVREAFLT